MLAKWLKTNLDSSSHTQASLARELSERLGRSIDRAAVNKMTTGGRKISADELIAITEILGIGKPDDASLRPKLVKSFDPDEIDPLEQHGDDRPDAAPHPADFPKDAILEAAPRGGMGAGETALTAFSREVDGVSEVDAIRPDYWRFPQRFLNETLRRPATALLVIECEGDSMQPTLAPGERVWVDTTHKIPSPDGIYAMRDRFENIVVKRLQLDESGEEPMILIISDNPSHSTTKRRLADVHIFGKVVGGFRMF
ncbi:S24 family peptidase [Bosea sp. NPDC055594]